MLHLVVLVVAVVPNCRLENVAPHPPRDPPPSLSGSGRVAGPRAVQLEHLGDGIDGGHVARVLKEVPSPDPRPCGELEDVAARPERLERRLELPHIGEPAGCGLGVEGVSGTAEPPVVLLRRPSAVRGRA